MNHLVKILFWGAVVFSASIGNAQEDKAAVEIEAQDRFIFNFGHENFIFGNRPDGFQPQWKSTGFSFQFMYDKPVGRGNLSFAIGLAAGRQNYHTNAVIRSREADLPNGQTVGDPDAPVHFENIEDNDAFEANRFSTSFVEVPVELRLRTNPNDKGFSWKFYPGFKVGYLFDVQDRQVFDGDKYKWFIFPDVATLRYGPTFRIAYGKVGLYGQYAVNSFFNEGQGPEMNQLSVGITIMPF